uniref:Uncharacterized protein n=1 Tax=Zea mays TaxID=4577 RepID=C4J839_MAIZE|nr:unknown [Zea mays]
MHHGVPSPVHLPRPAGGPNSACKSRELFMTNHVLIINQDGTPKQP